ncbi:YbaK/EbsC family protein [uncultured Ferrimonas sp.]|uniref:aminoacyl-tRNA deacylase n=1 Tax=uncultured Ferrimonas sp. TaxID=432640 RepID=UPI0026365D47|nr:YbaK/EbsC family protein [uncultured Ferrimonas sp.]
MAIARRVAQYLQQQGIGYRLVDHPHTQSALQSARSAGVPPAQTAKAVVLQDHQGHLVMAVIPAAHRLLLGKLQRELECTLSLLPERALADLFDDCEVGAVPATGDPYHLTVVYDESLLSGGDLYLEGGDHCHLLQVPATAVPQLFHRAHHGRFSAPPRPDYGLH